MSSVEQEECGLCCGVHMVVVLELRVWEQLILVILLFATEDLEVLLQLLVDALYLAI